MNMINSYNEINDENKRYKLGLEIFKKEIREFKIIFKKSLPLNEIFFNIKKIKDKSRSSGLFYRLMIQNFLTRLDDGKIRIADFNFKLINDNLKLLPLMDGLLLAQKKELEGVKIIREKMKYNFKDFKKTSIGYKIFKEFGYERRNVLSLEELNLIEQKLKKHSINLKILAGKTESENFFDSKEYTKNDFKNFFKKNGNE